MSDHAFSDVIVIAVILISAILAMVRGFVREVLAIASWLVAAVATFYLYETPSGCDPALRRERDAGDPSSPLPSIFIIVPRDRPPISR